MRHPVPAVLFCLVWGSSPLIAQPGSEAVSIRVLGLQPGHVSSVSLEATPLGGKTEPGKGPERLLADLDPSQPHLLSLDRRTPWRLRISTRGYWGPDAVLSPTAWPERLDLRLWPAISISGTVAAPEETGPPSALGLDFSPARVDTSPAEAPAGHVQCPVRDGRWTCELPSGQWDLRFQAQGFSPVLLWDADLRGGAFTNPHLKLKRGASLLGKLESLGRDLDAGQCEVVLKALAEADSARGAERLSGLSYTVHPTDRGYFHFQGVRPGSYFLQAKQPGLLSEKLFPITIQAETTTEITRPIRLEAPITLEVEVAPSADPAGSPWKVALSQVKPAANHLESVAMLEASGGVARIPALEPGRYVVQVFDNSKRAFATQELDLDWLSSRLRIDLDLVEVTGHVTLGEEPLAARLYFGGYGASALAMQADDDGNFSGLLPRPGSWVVEIRSEDPRVARRLAKVPVTVSNGGSRAEVEIRLPDTHLHGRTVDEAGTPVKGAWVRLIEGGQPTVTQSDEDGEFEFRGISAGVAILLAEDGDRRSDDQFVTVVENSAAPGVELRLRKLRLLAGSVESLAGPVVGARLLALPVVGNTFSVGTAQAVSDVQGNFEIRLPASASEVLLVAMASGFPLAVERRPVLDQQLLNLLVEPGGGTLVLDGAERAAGGLADRPLAVFIDGVMVDAHLLTAWASLNGQQPGKDGSVVVPNMPVGRYQACWLSPFASQPEQALSSTAAPRASCAEGFLTEAGELTLGLQ